MKKAIAAVAVPLFLLLATTAAAQRYGTFGVDVRLTTPAGELGDWHQHGVGAAAAVEYDLVANWRATGQFGFSRFSGKTIRGIPGSAPDLDVWGGAAGVRAYLGTGAVHVGAEFGYYKYGFSRDHPSNTGYDRDFGVLPSVGYRSGTFDLTAQYKLGGEVKWMQLRGTLYFVRF